MRGNGGLIGVPNIPGRLTAPGCWGAGDVARFLNGQYSGLFWPGVATDASFASVKGLYFFDQLVSANGAAIKDWSGNGNHLYFWRIGAVTSGPGIVLSTPARGYGYVFTPGSGAGLAGLTTMVVSAAFGTGDFTLEVAFYQDSQSTNQVLVDLSSNDANAVRGTLYVRSTNNLVWYANNNGSPSISGANNSVSTGALHFASVSRQSGNTFMHLDGTQQGSTFVDANNYVNDAVLIGNNSPTSGGTQPFAGTFAQVRITVGVGRYSAASYTPPGLFPAH